MVFIGGLFLGFAIGGLVAVIYLAIIAPAQMGGSEMAFPFEIIIYGIACFLLGVGCGLNWE